MERSAARIAIRKVVLAIALWVVGNVAWGIATRLVTKLSQETPMVEAIGYLVLIVAGLCWALWYILARDKRPSLSDMQREERWARGLVINRLAQEHNIKPSQISDLYDPQAMVERAQRLLVEDKLAALSSQPLVRE